MCVCVRVVCMMVCVIEVYCAFWFEDNYGAGKVFVVDDYLCYHSTSHSHPDDAVSVMPSYSLLSLCCYCVRVAYVCVCVGLFVVGCVIEIYILHSPVCLMLYVCANACECVCLCVFMMMYIFMCVYVCMCVCVCV